MSSDPSSKDMFEMFQRMVNPMAFPMQSLFMGALNVEEIEKKISELQTVRMWLNNNLGMLDLTIKTLEYQKALLAPASGHEQAAAENPLANPALWPWNFLNQQPAKDAPAAGDPAPPKRTGRKV